ncbi:MAG TPA: hypothetical protein VLE95_01215 [Chlamydiales bacterium]|nr:hypothetical protein [Chlamydiales bacterium]
MFDFSLNPYIAWVSFSILRFSGSHALFKVLFSALATGALLDLLSDAPLGTYPVSYVLATLILFQFRNRFHYERPQHIILFSVCVSLLSSVFQLFLPFLFDRRGFFAGQWSIPDWMGALLLDGIYAWFLITVPLYLWAKIRRNVVLFWLKRKRTLASR